MLLLLGVKCLLTDCTHYRTPWGQGLTVHGWLPVMVCSAWTRLLVVVLFTADVAERKNFVPDIAVKMHPLERAEQERGGCSDRNIKLKHDWTDDYCCCWWWWWWFMIGDGVTDSEAVLLSSACPMQKLLSLPGYSQSDARKMRETSCGSRSNWLPSHPPLCALQCAASRKTSEDVKLENFEAARYSCYAERWQYLLRQWLLANTLSIFWLPSPLGIRIELWIEYENEFGGPKKLNFSLETPVNRQNRTACWITKMKSNHESKSSHRVIPAGFFQGAWGRRGFQSLRTRPTPSTWDWKIGGHAVILKNI